MNKNFSVIVIVAIMSLSIGIFVFTQNNKNSTNTSKSYELNSQSADQPHSSVSNDDKCIITVFGKQYDVTSLRKSHPGGDIYNCGADMSENYRKQHGTNTSRISQYQIN